MYSFAALQIDHGSSLVLWDVLGYKANGLAWRLAWMWAHVPNKVSVEVGWVLACGTP